MFLIDSGMSRKIEDEDIIKPHPLGQEAQPFNHTGAIRFFCLHSLGWLLKRPYLLGSRLR